MTILLCARFDAWIALSAAIVYRWIAERFTAISTVFSGDTISSIKTPFSSFLHFLVDFLAKKRKVDVKNINVGNVCIEANGSSIEFSCDYIDSIIGLLQTNRVHNGVSILINLGLVTAEGSSMNARWYRRQQAH